MNRTGSFLKNISFTVLSNLVSLIISTLVTFIVPKFLGVKDYGLFQLYLMYCSYIGFLHFGWADGVLLRYGGAEYSKLDKSKFSAQFWMFSFLVASMGLLICFTSSSIAGGADKSTVFLLTGLAVIFLLPRTFLQYILQGTNRIKEYAILTVLEKVIFISLVLITIVAGYRNFTLMIIADLIGKLISLLYASYECRDILTSEPEKLRSAVIESRKNINVGLKLMFSNIASMLIIGIVRIAIENRWDLITFGQVSLTLSVSNLLMVFIRAIALVIFPMLRRTDQNKLPHLYGKIRTLLMIPLLGLLIFYYPMRLILSGWLPEYAEKLSYMALLFPMCIFESKMSMLIETYMKALRMERTLLSVNFLTLGLSIVLTGFNVYLIQNLDLAVLSIVILLAFRSITSEIILSKRLRVSVLNEIIQEVTLSAAFIFSSWFIGGFGGLVVYLISYIVYLVTHRVEVRELILNLKSRVQINI